LEDRYRPVILLAICLGDNEKEETGRKVVGTNQNTVEIEERSKNKYITF
jgi:hypothetical protein